MVSQFIECQQAINAIDIEWYKAGNTPCSYKVVDASECQQ